MKRIMAYVFGALGTLLLLGAIVWVAIQNPFPAMALMKKHPFTFSSTKEWGKEVRNCRLKSGGCIFISYPQTEQEATNQAICSFLEEAEKQYAAIAARKTIKRIPRLAVDYSAKNMGDYIALTMKYGIGEYSKNGDGADFITKEKHLYLDHEGNILTLDALLGEKNIKKLNYLMQKNKQTPKAVTAFTYFDEQVTLYWGEKSCSYSMKEIQKIRIIDPKKPMIALTFDDGPGKLTKDFSDLLYRYDARGTFFMLGQNVKNYKESVRYAYDQGHEIASHTMRHKNLNKLSKKAVKKEVDDADKAIAAVIGKKPSLIRAPYGNANSKVISIINRPVIHWNKDTEDWKSRDAKAVKEMILKQASDGSIILMHEIYQSTYDGLALALKELESKGYQFVTISEMMKYRKITPEAKVYYSFPKAK